MAMQQNGISTSSRIKSALEAQVAKTVKISPLAEIDLLDIALHIAAENPRASDKFAHEIEINFCSF